MDSVSHHERERESIASEGGAAKGRAELNAEEGTNRLAGRRKRRISIPPH
jgi:hypothetical protein